MDIQSRLTLFPLVLPEYSQAKCFNNRSQKLRKVTSDHMFPIKEVAIRECPAILYEQATPITLQDIIDNKTELLPTQLKSIIWQVTKLMLHCEKVGVSHLRLYPKAVVLKGWEPEKPFFVQIRDFSLGKEFKEVKDGKYLQFFKYLHPNLSVLNKYPDFSMKQPVYDIWSLGVILYELIYGQSPFCKQGKKEFSKTVLRKYLNKQYEVSYIKTKYSSINSFIGKCLGLENEGWNRWSDIRRFMVEEQEIYNELDFIDGRFEEMAGLHLQLMALFSGIYCMVIDECNNCPHPFWHKPISSSDLSPFQLKIAEFTLKLIKVLEERFRRVYSAHLFLLKGDTRQEIRNIGVQVQIELAHRGKQWIQKSFRDGPLSLQTINHIQEVCAQVKLQMSQLGFGGSSRRLSESQLQRKLWLSMQTLNEYCSEVICIFNRCKNRMKYVYEQFYLSRTLESLAINNFEYRDPHLPISSIRERFSKKGPSSTV